MQYSDNTSFMADYYKPLENFARASIELAVICEWMQEHEDVVSDEQEARKMALEVERRLLHEHGELYALALCQWASDHYSGKSADCEDVADGE